MLGICSSSHRSEDLLPQPEVFWNLRLSHVSFLLSSFFTVPVSSTMGLLSLPLCWFLCVQLPPRLLLSWARAVLGLFLAGAAPRLFQPGYIRVTAPSMSGECVISLVLSRHNKNLKQWTLKPSDRPCLSCRTDQCYSSLLQLSFIWKIRENTSSRREGMPTQRTQREERVSEREAPGPLAPLLCVSPSPGPAPCNLGEPGVLLFHLRPSLLCSIFAGFSLPCLLATAILDSFFLF